MVREEIEDKSARVHLVLEGCGACEVFIADRSSHRLNRFRVSPYLVDCGLQLFRRREVGEEDA